MTEAETLLQAIARAAEIGVTGRKRETRRTEMINRARDYCDSRGIGYSPSELVPARKDKPHSAPKHDLYRHKRSSVGRRKAA